MIISFLEVLAILVVAAKIRSFQKKREEIEKKNKEKNKEKEQQIILARKQREQIESRRPLEARIAAYLKKYEGVRFKEEELREKIILDYCDKVDFYRSLVAVTYWQRRDGFGVEADISNGKSTELYYYYEKPKQENISQLT